MSVAEPRAEYLGKVELRIPSKPEWVAVARLAVAAIANRLPFSVEEIEDLKLAMAEACTICITQGEGAEAIDITCEASSTHLSVEVQDDRYRTRAGGGKPHGPPVTTVEGEGLGIFLIQTLMDELEVHLDPQLGAQLAMTKRVAV